MPAPKGVEHVDPRAETKVILESKMLMTESSMAVAETRNMAEKSNATNEVVCRAIYTLKGQGCTRSQDGLKVNAICSVSYI